MLLVTLMDHTYNPVLSTLHDKLKSNMTSNKGCI